MPKPSRSPADDYPPWKEPSITQAFVCITAIDSPYVCPDVVRAALFLLSGSPNGGFIPELPARLLTVVEEKYRIRHREIPEWFRQIQADASDGHLGPADAIRRGLEPIYEVAELYDERGVRRYMQKQVERTRPDPKPN